VAKGGKRKIAQKKSAKQANEFVVVGNYKEGQLAWIEKNGVYNYPVREGDEFNDDALRAVKELWLFADVKSTRHAFVVKGYVGKLTKKEFIAKYPSYKKPTHDAYYVFEVTKLDYEPTVNTEIVIARTADFGGRSAPVKKAIEQFKRDGEFAPLAAYLPKPLTQVPPKRLRVSEEAVQLEFMAFLLMPKETTTCATEQTYDFFKDVRGASVAKALSLVPHDAANGFTHIDCFSGVGGFCTGLHAAGFTTLVAIEKIKSCVETYRANHPEVHVIHNDICQVLADEILPHCPAEGVDLVTSGMPCETFSTAGNTSRSFYDDRQFLFRQGIRIAQISNAKFILFENVPAITTKTVSKGSKELIVDVLKRELVSAGYKNYIEVVLDSTKFGVPQRRKRYFVLGTRIEELNLRKPSSTLTKVFTVGDAFADLPPVVPNTWEEGTCYTGATNPFIKIMRDDRFWRRRDMTTQHITYQMPMKHRPATLERFSLLRTGEGLRELFERYSDKERESLQARRVLPHKMFIKRNYRLPANQPSPTVTSHCLDEFVHPVENRALTVRECARLQSYPDSYDFKGGPYIVPHIDREVQDKYEQIGDAVPPLLAYAWGRIISQMLKEVE